jgi:hypothetical protein
MIPMPRLFVNWFLNVYLYSFMNEIKFEYSSGQNGCRTHRSYLILSFVSCANLCARNFVVKKVTRLILQKTLVWDGKRSVKDSEASAASKREGLSRTLTLYIAHNIPLDLYE